MVEIIKPITKEKIHNKIDLHITSEAIDEFTTNYINDVVESFREYFDFLYEISEEINIYFNEKVETFSYQKGKWTKEYVLTPIITSDLIRTSVIRFRIAFHVLTFYFKDITKGIGMGLGEKVTYNHIYLKPMADGNIGNTIKIGDWKYFLDRSRIHKLIQLQKLRYKTENKEELKQKIICAMEERIKDILIEQCICNTSFYNSIFNYLSNTSKQEIAKSQEKSLGLSYF